MPEMNGFEATEYIRHTMKSDIPIIALTADVTTVDLAKCKAVGMNDYIAKPVDPDHLREKIQLLMGDKHNQKKKGRKPEKIRRNDNNKTAIKLSYLNKYKNGKNESNF